MTAFELRQTDRTTILRHQLVIMDNIDIVNAAVTFGTLGTAILAGLNIEIVGHTRRLFGLLPAEHHLTLFKLSYETGKLVAVPTSILTCASFLLAYYQTPPTFRKEWPLYAAGFSLVQIPFTIVFMGNSVNACYANKPGSFVHWANLAGIRGLFALTALFIAVWNK